MGLFGNQVKVLVKKDFWVLKVHKKAICAEIFVPLLMAYICGQLLHGLNGTLQGSFYNDCAITNNTNVSFGSPTAQLQCLYTPAQPFEVIDDHLCAPSTIHELDPKYTGPGAHSNVLTDNYTYALEQYNAFDSTELLFESVSTASVKNESTTTFGPKDQVKIQYSKLQATNALKASTRFYSLFNPTPTIDDQVFFAATDNFGQLWADIIAFLLSSALLPMVISTAGRLVDEKRCKMREHLRVMGVKPAAYLLSVFGFGTIRVLMVSLIMLLTFVLSQQIIPFGDCLLAIITLFIYGHTMIAFSMIMPCLFSRSSFSSGAVLIFMTGGSIGAVYVTSLPAAAQFVLAFLFAPVANVMGVAQVLGQHTVTIPVTPTVAIIFLLLQLVGYCALSQYLYALFPGEYGVSQHPLFPIYLLKRWMSGDKKESAHSSNYPQSDGTTARSETPTTTASGGGSQQEYSIILEDLYKYYGSQRQVAAVNGLDLKVKKGEIMALLGHNGAGKTTTMSMLTGMLEATKYKTAMVDGLDLEKDVDLIRHKICVCPQFDILFEDLSAEQHMDIFATLKGVTPERGTSVLSRLGLPLDGQRSVTFSGGMKRRLSVACAMIGGSPIVFLDEPSSGLDPMSRRQLWDMIREERDQGKTIILSTHFMEEADYLGERIAIMSHGKLYCCDTSQKLKQEHGVGYYLTLVKEDMQSGMSSLCAPAEDKKTFDASAVLSICHKFCPGATLVQDSLGDATFLLPTESLHNYGDLLMLIDDQKTQYGVSSYGIRMNSLEDVFVNISEKESNKDDGLDMTAFQTDTLTTSGRSVEDLMCQATYDQSSISRFASQFITILRKKALFLQRSKRMWFLGLGVPLIMVTLAWLAVIPAGGVSSSLPSSASGTLLPHYEDWHVPVLGMVTAEQHDLLEKVSVLYTLYADRFPGAKPGLQGSMTFDFYKFDIARIGGYVNKNSISFNKLSHKFPAIFTFTPPNFQPGINSLNLIQAAITPDTPYLGRSVGIATYEEYQPFVPVHLMWLVQMARAQQDGKLDTVVFPNIVTAELTPNHTGNSTSVPTTDFCSDGKCQLFILAPVGILLTILCAQYAANAALQVADELNRHIFHTLRMHGLSSLAYWSATFAFDFLVAMLIVIGMTVGPYARNVYTLKSGSFLVFQALTVLGEISFTLLSTYAIICAFPSLKNNTLLTLILAMTILMLLLPLILSLVIHDAPFFLSIIFPPRAVVMIYMLDDPSQAFNNQHAVFALIAIWAWCVPAIVGIWVYSTGVFRKNRSPGAAVASASDRKLNGQDSQPLLVGREILDEDVAMEMRRVDQGGPGSEQDGGQGNMVEGIHLKKVYPGGKVAVKDMTFGLRVGECFGLLGPNGAGKTTSVKMLLREHAPTAGAIAFPYATGGSQPGGMVDLDKDYRVCRMGVCQQHDTLWETFTDNEHLEIYLRIRLGSLYRAEDWKEYIQHAIKKVYLDAEGKGAEEYSGGMKRKLAVAIALYTGAKTVFLDEPSTGMDPYARRAMWKSINEALANDRCVLLTTHSMEEADAVCARIAIVTAGEMQCIGSGQHLKNKFGKGFSITLLLQPPKLLEGAQTREMGGAEVQRYYESQYPQLTTKMQAMLGASCQVDETISNTVRYSLDTLNIAKAFQQLSQVSEEWRLESYSVNQVTSLEQIFLGFAGTGTAEA